jgi:hypothetical protein
MRLPNALALEHCQSGVKPMNWTGFLWFSAGIWTGAGALKFGQRLKRKGKL